MRIKLIALVLTLGLLSGCIGKVSLSERKLVQVIGVDAARDGYRLTLQVSRVLDAQGTGENQLIQQAGVSMTDIFTTAAIAQGKQLFLGSSKLIVIGEQVAEDGLEELLSFFNASHQISPSITVVIAKGQASDILRVGVENPDQSSDFILDQITNAQHAGFAPQSRLMDILGAINSENMAGSLSMIGIKDAPPPSDAELPPEPEEGEEPPALQSETPPAQIVELLGVGVFREGRLEQELDLTATRGLTWTQNQMKATPLTVGSGSTGRVAAVTSSEKAVIHPDLVGDHIVYRIEVQVRSSVLEVMQDDGTLTVDEKDYATLLQQRLIANEIEQAIEVSQRRGYDLFGLSLLMKQQHPDYYAAHKNQWAKAISNAGYQIDVRCIIDHVA